ncbi:SGNH/GDSL hydrolase family protein [Vibrio viridaestus]|uniref:SGNH/GDSL hydrolase family protein n=1 Tax=Vibrio viridaestus TaxID=2487322 RepID=A0A3N9TGG1_9VIBR|nr:SGNH/GDSL hydrolase family protein [Vibrio viridaestus]RQW63358.1 SGNH/GDSL hydrolase family protein [Vibrio viridaestus]
MATQQTTTDFGSRLCPISDISHIICLGASITDGIVNRMEDCIAQEFKRQGLSVKVIDEAEGGRGVEATLAAWEKHKSKYAGVRALVVIHTLGNDVSDFRPWSKMREKTKEALYTAMKTLIHSIWSNGNIPLLVNTSFRAYDNGDAIMNEDIGSKPFNEHIIYPLAKEMSPCNWLDDKPYMDWYDFYRNRNFHILNSDGTHSPNYTVIRRWYINNIVRRIRNESPLREARIDNPTQLAPVLPVKALVHFCVQPHSTGDSEFILGAHQVYSTGDRDSINLSPLEGYEPSSINMQTFFESNQIRYGSNKGALESGDITVSVTHDACKRQYTYTQSKEYVKHSSFSGFKPQQQILVTISAYRNSPGADKIGRYSVDHGKSHVRIDASVDNPTPHMKTLTAYANSEGKFDVYFMCDEESSSRYAFINAIMVEPL